MDDDEDLVLAGSALHEHLINCGFDPEVQSPHSDSEKSINLQLELAKESNVDRMMIKEPQVDKRMTSLIWPDSRDSELEVELAQMVVKSELLVTEDEEFLNNFLLSEDRLSAIQESRAEGGMMQDVLLFSGSLAAVAGAVFLLSERTRLAATAAAVLPSALAAVSSLRMGARVVGGREMAQFQQMIKQMLGDMKGFKQLLRKSLNLVQGMEMMNQGYMFAVSNVGEGGGPSSLEESKLSKALCKRSSFIALRKAIYTCTLQMVIVYRQSIHTLMELCPLEEHIDLKDHYLAFIELDNFGVEHNLSDERLTVRQLKDTIQLTLLQQSEYLRRFSLTFSNKVRQNECLNKAGILKHVKEIISQIRSVTDKLSNVLEYHQALGLLPSPQLEQKALCLKKQRSVEQVKKLLPLRNVYTSLFSTGLHLQNSLLKVRHLEGFFDIMERKKSGDENPCKLLPNEEQLLGWLQGFKEIQTELNACLTCLDDGVGEIDIINRPSSVAQSGEESEQSCTESSVDPADIVRVVIDDQTDINTVDEVFEAFIFKDMRGESNGLAFEDDFVNKEEAEKSNKKTKQSKKVLQELKSILVGKQKEWEVREARAIARQAKVDTDDVDIFSMTNNKNNGDILVNDKDDNLKVPKSLVQTNILGLSQETDSDAESLRSDTNTIKTPEEWCHGQSWNNSHKFGQFVNMGEEELLLASKLGDTRDASESSDESVASDCEVDRSRRLYCQGATMTTSYSDKTDTRAMVDLRSISTPDFKSFPVNAEASSPYLSLEKLLNEEKEEKDKHKILAHNTFPDFSSSTSSSSSSERELLGSNRSFQRPVRPAALKRKIRLLGKSQSVDKSSPDDPLHSSMYITRQREAGISSLINSQPQGFDSRLAAEAVAKSRQMRQQDLLRGETEEYFGSEESDTESGSIKL